MRRERGEIVPAASYVVQAGECEKCGMEGRSKERGFNPIPPNFPNKYIKKQLFVTILNKIL